MFPIKRPRVVHVVTTHEVSPQGNLNEILRGFVIAVNNLSTVVGSGLQAIALALSTPDDNSAEVQKQIDKHASQISAVKETLQSSIDRNQPKGD